MNARLLLLGLAAPLLLAAEDKPKAPLEEFTSRAGGFTVLMPGKPKEKEQTVKTPAGKEIKRLSYLIDQKTSGYLVFVSDIPGLDKADAKALDKALEDGRKRAEASTKGKLLSEKKVKLEDKHPGLEFQISRPKNGIYRSRIYIANGRLYQLVVFGPKEVATSELADKFLDSFKLNK
jgi:hypothetical protein